MENQFKKCTEIHKKIKDKNDSIFALKAKTMSPKNQIITDMPRSTGTINSSMDIYLERLSELESQKNKMQMEINEIWTDAICVMRQNNIKSEALRLLELRFHKGLPWKKCEAAMKTIYPNNKWNINKCFRTYRNTLYKLHKK